MSGPSEMEETAMRDYLKWELDPKLREQVSSWIQSGLEVEHFRRRLVFGTAGLRGQMGAGLDRMNSVTVMQATQGVVAHLRNKLGHDSVSGRGVAVAFDARHNSQMFAAVTAAVVLKSGVRLYLHPSPVPTPILAYTAKVMNCAGAVMITASHNPKNDNGYKLYGEDACQIIPPDDENVQRQIVANSEPWFDYTNTSIEGALGNPLCTNVTDKVVEAYAAEAVCKLSFRRAAENASAPPVVYSAFHGVGATLVERLFQKFHLKPYIAVPEQIEPDPDFTTLSFPNPEEGAGALELPVKTAEQHGASVILANDPDADRVAIAEKRRDGTWKLFSGNETAVLLASWMWCNRDISVQPEGFCMIGSAVSSKFLQAMAKKDHFRYFEALTGFKWLGHKVIDAEHDGLVPLLTFEEAIGFLLKDVVYDKDGVATAAVLAELVADLNARKKTLSELLTEAFQTYGYHLGCNGYIVCNDLDRMKEIFDMLRNVCPGETVAHARVDSVRDVPNGTDSAAADGKSELPAVGGTDFITIRLSSGVQAGGVDIEASFRASGTEPKFKYYSEIRVFDESLVEQARARLEEVIRSILCLIGCPPSAA